MLNRGSPMFLIAVAAFIGSANAEKIDISPEALRKTATHVITGDVVRVRAMGQHGTQANLNAGIVRSFSLNIPPRSEQTAIATVLSDMDAEITALETKLAEARQIRQGMMQELLTGRIRLV